MRCVDCGKPITRYATRCNPCAAWRRPRNIGPARARYIEIYGRVPVDTAEIRRRMAAWGMSIRQTERELGLAQGTISTPLRTGRLSIRNLHRLAMLFGCEPSDLQCIEPCPECGNPATPGYICCDECRARLREMIA